MSLERPNRSYASAVRVHRDDRVKEKSKYKRYKCEKNPAERESARERERRISIRRFVRERTRFGFKSRSNRDKRSDSTYKIPLKKAFKRIGSCDRMDHAGAFRLRDCRSVSPKYN